MINFDPSTGFTVDSTNELRAAIAADWKAVFDDESATLNTESESPAGQLIDSMSVLVTAKDSEFLNLANQFNPKTADGVFQDAIAAIYFLTRKTAQSTIVTCRCTGLYGTVIPAGSIIQNTDGIQLISTGTGVINYFGYADIEFACAETGAVDIGAGTCTKIITVIPGWDTVNNETGGVLGSALESRAAFEKRRRASVASNGRGSRLALEGALKAVENVTDCLVLENRGDGPTIKQGVNLIGHSVGICVYGGADSDIAETIYNKIDAGCGTNGDVQVSYTSEDGVINTYKIIRPVPTDLYVSVIINTTDTTHSTVIEDIKNAIFNDFYGNDINSGNTKVGLGEKIYASRFAVSIIQTAGVSDLVSIYIGWGENPSDLSLIIDANVEPVLSTDNISVTVNT